MDSCRAHTYNTAAFVARAVFQPSRSSQKSSATSLWSIQQRHDIWSGSLAAAWQSEAYSNRRHSTGFKKAATVWEDGFSELKKLTHTQLYRVWLQGAVFLLVLAATDAAFSGDWSRIGFISKDIENDLKPLVTALAFFHVGCAVVAANSARSKNLAVPPVVLKVLAVGFLALLEVLLEEPAKE